MAQALLKGDFVRVKGDSKFRPGQDGMVVEASDGLSVGLVFGFDRFDRRPVDTGIVMTGLTEEWFLDEIDLKTVEH
jgi:hypothetical protein